MPIFSVPHFIALFSCILHFSLFCHALGNRFPCLVATAITFFSWFKSLHHDLSNFLVFLASEALDTLNKLYESLGTYKTLLSLHFCVFLSGRIISSFTVPSAGPSSGLPSPSVTCCRVSRCLTSINNFCHCTYGKLHIQVPLEVAARAWIVTNASPSLPGACFFSAALTCFLSC